jgi:hypothetical protein
MASATIVLEAYIGGAWVSLAADTVMSTGLEISYGIQGAGPLDRVAGSGTCSFSLDNSVRNSGGVNGYYTPGHTNQRSGWEIGVPIRFKATFDSTTYYKFSGTLISVTPTAGQYRKRLVACSAVDWMDEAARSRVKNIDIATDQRSDQLVTTLVEDAVTKQPPATSFATGQSTFAYAFDNLSDAQTTVLRALADVVISELGYLYVKGDTTQGGTLTFEDRHTRPKKGAASADFNETMAQLDVARSRQDLINRVYVVVHPRTIAGSASALYELTTTQTVPSIPPLETINILAPFKEASINAYRVAGQSLITPVSGTDWIANTAADGSGSNITSDVAVTLANTSANSVEFQIVNNHATSTAYLTTLQIRGTQVRDTTETILTASDSASQTSYGEIDTRINMIYESNAGEFGNEIAKWILNIYKDPRNVIQSMTVIGNSSDALMTQVLAREPGDKITLTESMTGISSTGGSGAEIGFFINGVDLNIAAGGIITATWTLAPAEQQAAWILNQVGASEIGITTNLGFA